MSNQARIDRLESLLERIQRNARAPRAASLIVARAPTPAPAAPAPAPTTPIRTEPKPASSAQPPWAKPASPAQPAPSPPWSKPQEQPAQTPGLLAQPVASRKHTPMPMPAAPAPAAPPVAARAPVPASATPAPVAVQAPAPRAAPAPEATQPVVARTSVHTPRPSETVPLPVAKPSEQLLTPRPMQAIAPRPLGGVPSAASPPQQRPPATRTRTLLMGRPTLTSDMPPAPTPSAPPVADPRLAGRTPPMPAAARTGFDEEATLIRAPELEDLSSSERTIDREYPSEETTVVRPLDEERRLMAEVTPPVQRFEPIVAQRSVNISEHPPPIDLAGLGGLEPVEEDRPLGEALAAGTPSPPPPDFSPLRTPAPAIQAPTPAPAIQAPAPAPAPARVAPSPAADARGGWWLAVLVLVLFAAGIYAALHFGVLPSRRQSAPTPSSTPAPSVSSSSESDE